MPTTPTPEGEDAFPTRAVHAGTRPDPTTGAVTVPVYQTSTYVQEAPARHKGYEYSRTQNPTREALEEGLASLERAAHGVAFASGMSAIDAICRLLDAGDRIVAGNDLYGGTYRLFEKVLSRAGLEFTYADPADLDGLARAIEEVEPRLVWIETPTNPLLKVADIALAAEAAHAADARLVVDNTFASPYLQRPLELGADIVCHSTTKYLAGHSDVVGGVVCVDDEATAGELRFIQNSVGAVPGPWDAFLVHRGIKTLAVRMDRHCRNAEAVGEFLASHEAVRRVIYPGREDHPGHDVAGGQMRNGFGGMVSVELACSLEEARAFTTRTRLFQLAESLGGVESLVEHPASMTHASIPAETRRAAGLTDGLIRLSVGIEDGADLVADLGRALAPIS